VRRHGWAARVRSKPIGSAAIDIYALSEIVARISELADDHRATIAEMDFNPSICGANRITAVDAL
jgi:acetate---CoA ligase (ADP-forming)